MFLANVYQFGQVLYFRLYTYIKYNVDFSLWRIKQTIFIRIIQPYKDTGNIILIHVLNNLYIEKIYNSHFLKYFHFMLAGDVTSVVPRDSAP